MPEGKNGVVIIIYKKKVKIYIFIQIFIETYSNLPVEWLLEGMHCGVICIVGSILLVLK